ncbi:hypothetical protein BO99DRAFT_151376 [Aspergillus violaceofuscus CBS 115571]|uniref:Uncharacterized protein n=1 Tax=Aspergillus violaceofuscus (strain CBS 115571) TaxID=1450538 RepID=A0A2V5HGZ4_ASPV1|nr:hypothetical protein BO99DRAFT_151376 [Aspergillus violaceofuscus CBS 115571]
MGNFHASRTTILTLTLTRAQCNAPATLPASRHAEVRVLARTAPSPPVQMDRQRQFRFACRPLGLRAPPFDYLSAS